MDPYPAPDYVVPGMKVGCLPYQALANSTLVCFFSASCLGDTARWISSLPPSVLPKPLSRSGMINFEPNTPVSVIFANVMLDHWKQAVNYSCYYHACDPVQCTFAASSKNSFIYLVTLIIGLYGGLTVTLRIIAPLLIVCGRFVLHQFKQRCLLRRQSHIGTYTLARYNSPFHTFRLDQRVFKTSKGIYRACRSKLGYDQSQLPVASMGCLVSLQISV